MPRKRRFFLPAVPVHIVQRGNNRQAVFIDDNNGHSGDSTPIAPGKACNSGG
jgi:REP element-mobilizing transposase RayT